MELTTCPECGNAAEILWRDVLESTDGPIEHAKVACVDRHWFVLPVAALASPGVFPTDATAFAGRVSRAAGSTRTVQQEPIP